MCHCDGWNGKLLSYKLTIKICWDSIVMFGFGSMFHYQIQVAMTLAKGIHFGWSWTTKWSSSDCDHWVLTIGRGYGPETMSGHYAKKPLIYVPQHNFIHLTKHGIIFHKALSVSGPCQWSLDGRHNSLPLPQRQVSWPNISRANIPIEVNHSTYFLHLKNYECT